MDATVWVPLVSALAGALIGAVGTVATVWLQSRKEERRERRALAFQFASDQHARALEHVHKRGGSVLPVDVFVAHTLALIRAAEAGPLTREALDRVWQEMDLVESFILEREQSQLGKT